MSRQSHLPPRCPFQTKSTTFPSHDFISPSTSNDCFTPRHQKSVSQSFACEDQPPWLDDILSETNANSKGGPLRRLVSDSVTLLGGHMSDESLVSNENGSGLESSCMYGPNSPRGRGSVDSLENTVVSKLTDYFSQTPTSYPGGGLIESGIVWPNSMGDAGGLTEVANVETRTVKRHSGQRSRVRKLQYIAELERTVEVLQSSQSELAIKVASLLQHRVALSMENNTLKQQLARLKQEKVFVEGQYRSLKTELKRLKNHLAYSAEGHYGTDFRPSSVKEEAGLESAWEMLDIGKLNLNQ